MDALATPGVADERREPCLKEVPDERMCASGRRVCGRVAEQALPFALLDECASFIHGDARGDGTEDEIDGVEQRCAHEELLEIRGQVADHFLGEVVVEVALGAAEG